ncbi:hypothetical protein pb186bvf_018009 [Paramecium bursaria]
MDSRDIHFKKQNQYITQLQFNKVYLSGLYFIFQDQNDIIINRKNKRLFRIQLYAINNSIIRKNYLIVNIKETITIIDFNTRQCVFRNNFGNLNRIIQMDLQFQFLFILTQQCLYVYDNEQKEIINQKELSNAYNFFIQNQNIIICQADQIIICNFEDLSIITLFDHKFQEVSSLLFNHGQLLILNTKQYQIINTNTGKLSHKQNIRNFYAITTSNYVSFQDIQSQIDNIEYNEFVKIDSIRQSLFILNNRKIILGAVDKRFTSRFYDIKILKL